MAYPTIVFNSSTGNDGYSGAGPGDGTTGGSVITGTSASFSGSVVTLDGSPDLSGVASDGSHCLYLVTSTGRRYFRITAVNDGADQVTLGSAPAGTASGLTWAIGGKRATWDHAQSRLLFASSDGQPGWTIETETAQSLTSLITITAGGSSSLDYTIRGSSGSRKTVTQTANAAAMLCSTSGSGYWRIENLKIQNSNGTKTAADGITADKAYSEVFIVNCEVGDSTNTLRNGIYRSNSAPHIYVIDCYVHHCTAVAVSMAAGDGFVQIHRSVIANNAGDGVYALTSGGFTNNKENRVISTVIAFNGGYGVQCTSTGGLSIESSTIHGNTSHGVYLSGTPERARITNNNITANGGNGINSPLLLNSYVGYNNFGTGATANTSGARSGGILAGTNDVEVDPGYTNAAALNFAVGTGVKAIGTPGNIGFAGLTTSYVDIGAAQRQEPVTLLENPGLSGGMNG